MVQAYDYLLKMLLIGDSGVGKSSALLRYANDTFSTDVMTTIGVDFKIKTVTRGKHTVKLQIWDTAGAERFRTITSSYYRGAAVVFLCFDASGKAHSGSDGPSAAVESLQKYRGEIEQHCSANVVVVVCGLKSDLQNDDVVGAGMEFAEKYDYHFCTCSAKTNQGVEEMFVDEGVDGYIEDVVDGGAEVKKCATQRRNLDDDDESDDEKTSIAKKKKDKKTKKRGSFFPSAAQIFGLKK